MKCVKIQISDEDYFDLVEHFARRRAGRPLVGVVSEERFFKETALNDDIAERRKALGEGEEPAAPKK